jgi:hypothetical protein
MFGAPSIVPEVDWGTMVTPVPLQYLAAASCSPQALHTRQLKGSPGGATLVASRPSAVKLKLRLKSGPVGHLGSGMAGRAALWSQAPDETRLEAP